MYLGFNVMYRYSCRVLMKLEYSRQILEKYSNTKFREKSILWESSCLCEQKERERERQTDRHDEVNPLNAELNPISNLLALLGGATIVVPSRLRVNSLFSLLC